MRLRLFVKPCISPGKADRQEKFDQILQESIEAVAGEDDERKAHVKKVRFMSWNILKFGG